MNEPKVNSARLAELTKLTSDHLHDSVAMFVNPGKLEQEAIQQARDFLSTLQELADLRWQPIETVPKDGTPVLVWLPKKMLGSHVHAARFHPNVVIIGGVFDFDTSSKPTHWMKQPLLESDHIKG